MTMRAIAHSPGAFQSGRILQVQDGAARTAIGNGGGIIDQRGEANRTRLADFFRGHRPGPALMKNGDMKNRRVVELKLVAFAQEREAGRRGAVDTKPPGGIVNEEETRLSVTHGDRLEQDGALGVSG